MIDIKTGTIRLTDTCQLHAGDSFVDVSAFPLGENWQVVEHQNGWQWLTIKNLTVDEH